MYVTAHEIRQWRKRFQQHTHTYETHITKRTHNAYAQQQTIFCHGLHFEAHIIRHSAHENQNRKSNEIRKNKCHSYTLAGSRARL